MSIDRQTEMRDEFSTALMREVNLGGISIAEACAAAIGACAAVAAVIQDPEDRRKTALALIADFPERCEHRHREIMRRVRN